MSHVSLPHHHECSLEHVLEHMPETADFQVVADLFKQLCDGSRIRIFWLLCHCEECVESCRIASSTSAEEQRPDRQQTLWQRGVLSSGRYEPGTASAPYD